MLVFLSKVEALTAHALQGCVAVCVCKVARPVMFRDLHEPLRDLQMLLQKNAFLSVGVRSLRVRAIRSLHGRHAVIRSTPPLDCAI